MAVLTISSDSGPIRRARYTRLPMQASPGRDRAGHGGQGFELLRFVDFTGGRNYL
jgi:hypothetical protein